MRFSDNYIKNTRYIPVCKTP